jgi:serine O-acetyltransferase
MAEAINFRGADVKMGQHTVIHPNVHIGNFSEIGCFVELRTGTFIGERVKIDSGVKMSGDCHIGHGTIIRYDCKIARDVFIGSGCYICPDVMFEYWIPGKERADMPTTIGDNVTIGTKAVIRPGIHIGDGARIGEFTLVTKNVPAGATVVGIPGRIIKGGSDAE